MENRKSENAERGIGNFLQVLNEVTEMLKRLTCEDADPPKINSAEVYQCGEYERAVEFYTKEIENKPKNAALYNRRALAYMNMKLYDKVVEDARKALEINATSLKSSMILAKAYFMKGDTSNHKKAIEDMVNRNKNKAGFVAELTNQLKKKLMETTGKPERPGRVLNILN